MKEEIKEIVEREYQKLDVSTVFEIEDFNYYFSEGQLLFEEIQIDALKIYNEAESIDSHSCLKKISREETKK